MVGTLRKSKKEIPPGFINMKRPVPRIMFSFQDMLFFWYKTKSHKNTLMLLRFCSGDYINLDSDELQKQEIAKQERRFTS